MTANVDHPALFRPLRRVQSDRLIRPVAHLAVFNAVIRFHLRPYRIPMDILREKHSAVLGMVTKLLGELRFTLES